MSVSCSKIAKYGLLRLDVPWKEAKQADRPEDPWKAEELAPKFHVAEKNTGDEMETAH